LNDALDAVSVTSGLDTIAVASSLWEEIKDNIIGNLYVPP